MGLKPSGNKVDMGVVSEEEANPTHSASSIDLDLEGGEGETEGTGGTERDPQDSPELLVRGKFAFTGEGEDEVRHLTCL